MGVGNSEGRGGGGTVQCWSRETRQLLVDDMQDEGKRHASDHGALLHWSYVGSRDVSTAAACSRANRILQPVCATRTACQGRSRGDGGKKGGGGVADFEALVYCDDARLLWEVSTEQRVLEEGLEALPRRQAITSQPHYEDSTPFPCPRVRLIDAPSGSIEPCPSRELKECFNSCRLATVHYV